MTAVSAGRTPAQLFALVFGLIYLTIGIVGFFVTGFDGFAAKTYDEKLLAFPLNPLHNIAHLVLGIGWLAASFKHDLARITNMLFGIVLGVLTILGMAGTLEFLAIKDSAAPDNFLHLGSSMLSLYFGSAGAEGPNASVDI